MKARTITPMSALHPALFFAGVYLVALLFSIFICSSIFYSCNSTATEISKKEQQINKSQVDPVANNSNSTVAALH